MLEFAVGHGVSASWSDGEGDRTASVATEWLPVTSVSGTSAAGQEDLGAFTQAHPRALEAAWLGGVGGREEVAGALDAFVDAYECWVERRLTGRLERFGGQLAEAALRNRDRCAGAATRMRLGVATLAGTDDAWSAFVLANEALDRQSNYPVKGDRRGSLR